MLQTLEVENYRSLRSIVVPLGRLNVIQGANGSGKSNLYKALRLLADTAAGGVVGSLAREGGLKSTFWAGPEKISQGMRAGRVPVQGSSRKEPVRLKLGFSGKEFGYCVTMGLPAPAKSAFALDPEIKRECIWSGQILRPSAVLVDRRGPLVKSREATGGWSVVTHGLATFDSMMTHCADPRNTPEMLMLREEMRGWRFYDQFRTDLTAPARLRQIGTHTPILSHDGTDLAAALETILHIGDGDALNEAIGDAFPGGRVGVSSSDGWFEVEMHQHGLLRPLKAAELSDGTLRYLLWVAALLTPRPPGLLVLNEPETSLHPDLLPALGRLIAQTAARAQILIVSHAPALIDALQQLPECHSITLEKKFGETVIVGQEQPAVSWQWPAR